MSLRPVLVLHLLVSIIVMGLVSPIIPTASSATTPVVMNHMNPPSPNCNGTRTCKTNSASPVNTKLQVNAIGDTITVQVAVTDIEASCSAPTLGTPTSTPVYTWTPLPGSPQHATGGNVCDVQGFWTSTVTSTTPINFTFTETGGTLADVSFAYILLDWNNLDPTQLDSQVGKCVSACTTSFVPLSSPLTFNPYNVIIGFWTAQQIRQDSPPTDPSGTTQYGSLSVGISPATYVAFSYVKVASSSGTTLYSGGVTQTTLASQLNWAVTLRGGADFTVVVACNWFQLQCWWYPLFFFSTYACLIIPLAKAGEINRRDFGWVFLSGFTLSSLIGVVMGMISIMVPMFLVGLGVLVALRS